MSPHIATLLFALHCLLASCSADSCRLVPGALVQVDVGIGQLFGVNGKDEIWTLNGPTWTQVPGSLKHVTVGPAGVWGVNAQDKIFKLVATNWVEVPGSLKQIDAGGPEFVVGVTTADAIYYLPRDYTVGYSGPDSTAEWVQIPGGLKYSSCGPYSCWGVSNADQIWVRKVASAFECQGYGGWKQISGSLAMVEVASDGSVYGVNSFGQVHRRNDVSAANPEGSGWTHIPLHTGQMLFIQVTYNRGPAIKLKNSLIMVSVVRSFMVLLLHQMLIGGTSGLIPDTGRRKHAESGRQTPGQSESFLNDFELRLLNMFGLKRRPTPSKTAIVPQYMLDLYRLHSENGDHSTKPVRNVMAKHAETAASRSNTIRSFHHEESLEALSSLKGRTTQQFFFNVSFIPSGERVNAAELRIFREQVLVGRDSGSRGNGSLSGGGQHRINVYEVFHPARSGGSAGDGGHQEALVRLMDTRLVQDSHSRWESFDVGSAVQRWTSGTGPNHGLMVEVVHPEGDSEGGDRGESGAGGRRRHVRVSRSLHGDEDSWAQARPLLVTYSHDGQGGATLRSRRDKRQASGRRGAAGGGKQRKKHPRASCRRHPLYVDFSDVGWNEWIVAPPGYHAFYCHGECPFPLAEHLNSTNHAIVQTLVNSVNSNIPRACCVPTELSPISLLYLDEYEKVILKNYQDMVVEGCGCR